MNYNSKCFVLNVTPQHPKIIMVFCCRMAEGDVAAAAPAGDKYLKHEGPKPGVKYPLKVLYCSGNHALFFHRHYSIISLCNLSNQYYISQNKSTCICFSV